MINVQTEVIDKYLTDSENKELEIERLGIDPYSINYYIGDVTNGNKAYVIRTCDAGDNAIYMCANKSPWSTEFFGYIHEPITDDWDTMLIRFTVSVTAVSGNIQRIGDCIAGVRAYYDPDNPNMYHYWYNQYSHRNTLNENTFYVSISRASYEAYMKNAYRVWIYLVCVDGSTVEMGDTIEYTNYSTAVYYAKSDFNRKIAWAVHPDFDQISADNLLYLVNNENLLYEDFQLTESLCSRNNIKFGLCEAAYIEFSEVGVDVEVGDVVKAKTYLTNYPHSALSSDDITEINWIPSSPTEQFSVTRNNSNLYYIVVTQNYNPYYFDLNPYYEDFFAGRYFGLQMELQITVSDYSASERPTYIKLWGAFLTRYGNTTYVDSGVFYPLADFENDYSTISGVYPTLANQTYDGERIALLGIYVGFYKSDKSLYNNGETISATYNFKRIQLHAVTSAWDGTTPCPIPAYNPSMYLVYDWSLDEYLKRHTNDIPLGVFKVASVENEYKHNLVRKKITAYDNLLLLENNAADWYTRYMFGVDMDGWISNGFEYARQIFSTYWNYVTSIGLDSRDNYKETRIAYYEYWNDIKPSHLANKYLTWQSSSTIRLRYCEFEVQSPDPDKMYMVSVNNVTLITDVRVSDDYILKNFIGDKYREQIDPLARGVCTNGGVMVWEVRSDGTSSGICVNRDEYFMISPNCQRFTVYVPVYTVDESYSVINRLIDDVTIYSVETKPELTNGHLRLCYYNYGTKEIFDSESSITGRDVVRSLLEVCGCFFRLDRYNGLPEFVYPTKGGLYPSNTLYPADDLYPRAGTDQLYPMGKYISVTAENYEVKNYGRIQILKDIKSSDTQSVVEWQYEGDPDSPNTYIIDDNIFYCAEEMEYDYDGMPEVAAMLEGMWGVISNLGYVPNVTQALGAPWVECGDRVGLLTFDGGFETFVFRRTLKGIQNLRDTYESEGDELNEAISNFGYSV